MTTKPPAEAMDPNGQAPQKAGTPVTVTLQADQLGALDAWIDEQQPKPSRPEAIRRLLHKALPTPNTTAIRSEFG